MSQYGKPEYWEERYSRSQSAPFDWYQRLSGFHDWVAENVKTNEKILNIGAGSSKLSEELFDEGYQNIINIDISKTCIANMQEKYQDKGATFQYIKMDARKLEFENNSFDCVIDKGLLDCILCGENSLVNTEKTLSEIYRVLSPNGIYIMISYADPELRDKFLQTETLQWEITKGTLAKPAIFFKQQNKKETLVTEEVESPNHYIYLCRKTG